MDHPRPTKAVLSYVNREAGILRGMLGVAHMFDSAWSTGLARMLSLKYLLDSGRPFSGPQCPAKGPQCPAKVNSVQPGPQCPANVHSVQ